MNTPQLHLTTKHQSSIKDWCFVFFLNRGRHSGVVDVGRIDKPMYIRLCAKKRKIAIRDKIVRFLVVCEGERTEPNYFKELVKDRYSEVRSEEIVGEGRSTCALVKRAADIKTELEHQRQLPFDRVL